MAEPANIAALFPTPPPFYKHFTKDNLTRLRQLQRTSDADPTTLPLPLQHLLPPPPPPNDTYRSFGTTITLHGPDPDLTTAGVPRLYPLPAPTDATSPDAVTTATNPQPHLLALARSTLTTFLSLAGALATDPGARAGAAAGELKEIVWNMHELINRYRPHQARETLVLAVEERVERLRAEGRRVDEVREEVVRLLGKLREEGVGKGEEEVEREEMVEGGVWSAEETRRERQRGMWRALEREVGGLGG